MSTVSDELSQLWQRQALDAPRISLAYVRHRTNALQRRTMLRNGLEYVGGFAGIAFMLWFLWTFLWNFFVAHPLYSLGFALWVVGMLVVMVQWHRRAAVQAPAEQLGTLDALAFYRRQLERQRDARRGNWRWWLPPMAPCIVMFFISLFVEVRPTPWVAIGVLFASVIVMVGLGVLGYERAARHFQREIDALDSMTPKS